MNRKLKVCIFVILFCLFLDIKVEASTFLNGIENFPSSYQPYLRELAKKHSNWKFVALYTNLDWNRVINEENAFGKNLVPKNYSDSWKNTTPGQYNIEVDDGWVDSSRQALEFCMDPRNFLNEIRLFQFEGLSFDDTTNNITGIEKILYGTEFYSAKVSYLNSNGNTINMNETYSDLILKAGRQSRVSSYHLASRIKQEVGPFLSHSSISGTVEGFKGLYNFYNIGATSSTEPMGAIKNGLQYAKDAKGASQNIKDKYLIPWDTKEKAITGGAIFLGSSYINLGQNTIYLQKFDVNDAKGGSLFWHQYMTNVLAPYSESRSIYTGYQKIGMLDNSLTFIIPVYENMPNVPTQNPNINSNDFIGDDTIVYCTKSNVNVRTGPSNSYEVLTTVTYGDKMRRIEKGINSGERWDKVVLESGIIGYIFQDYLEVVSNVQIESITLSLDNTVLEKGERKQLQVKILPEDASNHKVTYTSSNKRVASIDDKGSIRAISSGETTITVKASENSVQSQINITVHSGVNRIMLDQTEFFMKVGDKFKINGNIEPQDADNKNIIYSSSNENIAIIDKDGVINAKGIGEVVISAIAEDNLEVKAECILIVVSNELDGHIQFDNSITLNSLEISGIDFKKNKVLDIKNKIVTDLEIEVVDKNGIILEDNKRVGTGCRVIVKKDGNILRQYVILLYGDVNGDGLINSIDLLLLQRHVLQIEELKGIYKKAGNIAKDGNKLTAIDLLIIQRHILEIEFLKQ